MLRKLKEKQIRKCINSPNKNIGFAWKTQNRKIRCRRLRTFHYELKKNYKVKERVYISLFAELTFYIQILLGRCSTQSQVA